ncbi:DTW domain-containing protein 1-like [Cyclospora cayetanensis]|uniref:tRNA-uridine aminocarboxypropyltransferase 1 n=1 Tax=Cyclospora cayetanensis TaxID=88456 RepID=A0A6P6RS45_9EIME|nr:DTW domain-containing protein 1-like [Cyclospora cayetanensis]
MSVMPPLYAPTVCLKAPSALQAALHAEDYTPLLPDIQGARAPSTCNGGPSSDPPPRRRSESAVAGRRRCCGGCGRQRAFYCSSCCCLVLSEATASHVPRVALPFRLHVVRHPKEKAAKSSAIPLRLLAPNDAVLYEVHGSLLSTRVWGGPSGGPPSPWASRKGVVLLLPEEGAPPASRIRWEEITDVVVADCTWYQVPGMQKHPALKELPRVRLDGQGGAFWRRHKGGPPEFLSSAEAVYLLLRERDGGSAPLGAAGISSASHEKEKFETVVLPTAPCLCTEAHLRGRRSNPPYSGQRKTAERRVVGGCAHTSHHHPPQRRR